MEESKPEVQEVPTSAVSTASNVQESEANSGEVVVQRQESAPENSTVPGATSGPTPAPSTTTASTAPSTTTSAAPPTTTASTTTATAAETDPKDGSDSDDEDDDEG